jgi:hypothetical protein
VSCVRLIPLAFHPPTCHTAQLIEHAANVQQLSLADPAPLLDKGATEREVLPASNSTHSDGRFFAFRRVDRTHDLLKTIEREIIQALSKSEPLAFREIRGPIQRPTHQLTDDRVKGRRITHK